MKKLPNLTPLRFFLATLVLLYHLPQLSKNQGLPYFDDLPIFHRGIEAVNMFFVLSGFLIIRLIYKEKVNQKFSIKRFYMRRVLRILPLYYFIVFFGFAFYQLIIPALHIPFENNYDLKTGLSLTIFFLPNIFASYKPGGILEVLWSIGIEEQFYLIIAPLLYFLNSKRILYILSIIFVLYLIIYHRHDFYFLRKYHFIYFFMLSGGIISILEEQGRLQFLKKNKFIPLITITCTFLFFFTDLFLFENKLVYNGFICLLFTLFIYSICYLNYKFEIKNKLVTYLGKISYGIYMYHVIALNIVAFIFLKIQKMNIFSNTVSIILMNIMTLLLTITIAHLSYKYFESYFLKLKNKYRTEN